ncbi:MAG: PTS sugar transporter subunit IIA [Planctomycetota bacterium]
MNLIEVLRTECIVPGSVAKDKAALLHEIARISRRCPSLAKVAEAAILTALGNRESLGSTGFGGGIAIPHCRMPEVSEFVMGIVTSAEGVDFEALDDRRVRLFVFIIAPEQESDRHIRLLSAVSQILRMPGVVDELLRAPTAEAVRESFLRHSRVDVETKGHEDQNLFHVFVQNEDYFKEILQVFAAMGSCSTLVLDAEKTATYLARVPLFAGFWSDSSRGFNRIIIAVVDKRLTNETIRRIEEITGSLDKANDTLLVVQELFYSSGHLNA